MLIGVASPTKSLLSSALFPSILLRDPGVSTTAALRILRAGSGAAEAEPIEMENVDCPNCGISHHETVLVAEDILTHLGGTFRIVRCHDCQLAFTNPRPTA